MNNDSDLYIFIFFISPVELYFKVKTSISPATYHIEFRYVARHHGANFINSATACPLPHGDLFVQFATCFIGINRHVEGPHKVDWDSRCVHEGNSNANCSRWRPYPTQSLSAKGFAFWWNIGLGIHCYSNVSHKN